MYPMNLVSVQICGPYLSIFDGPAMFASCMAFVSTIPLSPL